MAMRRPRVLQKRSHKWFELLFEIGRCGCSANQQYAECGNGFHERRSSIDCKISAIASVRGLVPISSELGPLV